MQLHFNKWGNSLAVRFPKAITEMLGVADGSAVEAEMVDGKVVLSTDPLDKLRALAKKGPTLKELMAAWPVDFDPTEDPEIRLWLDAPPVGKEIIEDDWS